MELPHNPQSSSFSSPLQQGSEEAPRGSLRGVARVRPWRQAPHSLPPPAPWRLGALPSLQMQEKAKKTLQGRGRDTIINGRGEKGRGGRETRTENCSGVRGMPAFSPSTQKSSSKKPRDLKKKPREKDQGERAAPSRQGDLRFPLFTWETPGTGDPHAAKGDLCSGFEGCRGVRRGQARSAARRGGASTRGCGWTRPSEVFLEKVQQRDFVMLPRLRAANTVSLVGVDLQAERQEES